MLKKRGKLGGKLEDGAAQALRPTARITTSGRRVVDYLLKPIGRRLNEAGAMRRSYIGLYSILFASTSDLRHEIVAQLQQKLVSRRYYDMSVLIKESLLRIRNPHLWLFALCVGCSDPPPRLVECKIGGRSVAFKADSLDFFSCGNKEFNIIKARIKPGFDIEVSDMSNLRGAKVAPISQKPFTRHIVSGLEIRCNRLQVGYACGTYVGDYSIPFSAYWHANSIPNDVMVKNDLRTAFDFIKKGEENANM